MSQFVHLFCRPDFFDSELPDVLDYASQNVDLLFEDCISAPLHCANCNFPLRAMLYSALRDTTLRDDHCVKYIPRNFVVLSFITATASFVVIARDVKAALKQLPYIDSYGFTP